MQQNDMYGCGKEKHLLLVHCVYFLVDTVLCYLSSWGLQVLSGAKVTILAFLS